MSKRPETPSSRDAAADEESRNGSRSANAQSKRRASTIGFVPSGPPGADREAIPQEAPGMKRNLSFIDVTTDEMSDLVNAEMCGQEWLQGFWFRVLTAPAAPASKSLALRTLTYFVQIFNRWQSQGNWKAGEAPQFNNANEMQEMCAIPLPRVMEFVKLFDPPGHARVTMTKSPQDYLKVKVPVAPFLTACIIMSSAIAKQHKLRFLLGIFDESDKLRLQENEFVALVQALFVGMAALFGLKSAPPTQRIETYSKYLYSRVAELDPEQTGSIPFALLEEWLLGKTQDPASLPFALLFERFSVSRDEENPDQFEDPDRIFRLSHKAPVQPPMDTTLALDVGFMDRHEVVLAEKIYNHCISTATWHLSHSEAEKITQMSINPEYWIEKLHRALDEMDSARGHGVKLTLSTFFKKLCPRASTLHLRMFHNWLKEKEDFEDIKKEYLQSQERLRIYQRFVGAGVLPSKVRQDLLAGWQDSMAHFMRQGNSENEEGSEVLEKEDYIARFCPEGWRSHPGYTVVDETLEKMLFGQASMLKDIVQQKERLFAERGNMESRSVRKEDFVKRQVSWEEWKSWNEVFDLLEQKGEILSPGILEKTRLVCPALVEHIYVLVSGKEAFTRERFLETMLKMTLQRPPRR